MPKGRKSFSRCWGERSGEEERARHNPIPSGCVHVTNAQPESRQRSFIWGEIRTEAQEMASQGTPRNGSQEARGELGYRSFCNKGKVVGTKDLQVTGFRDKDFQKARFSGKRRRFGLPGLTPLMRPRLGASCLCVFPEFPQGSLAPSWERLFSEVTMTPFVLST